MGMTTCLNGAGDPETRELQNEINIVFQRRIHNLISHLNLDNNTAGLVRFRLEQKGAGQRTYFWVNLIFKFLLVNALPNKADWENCNTATTWDIEPGPAK